MKKIDHIAFILDGNGRWAKEQNKPRTYGHKIGMNNIFDTIVELKKYDIKYATLFCFSTENWNRPKQEVDFLMDFPGQVFSKKEQEKYKKEGIKINWIGRRTKVPKHTYDSLTDIENQTSQENQIIVNIAIDYGSLEEIENCFKIVFNNYKNNLDQFNLFNIQNILDNLYTKDSPPIDLLIRTGGEQRLSNFLLLQSAYAELYFTKVFWPAFDKECLKQAIENYYSRDRRYGGIKEDEQKN